MTDSCRICSLSLRFPSWTSNRLKRLSLAPKQFLVDAGLFVSYLAEQQEEIHVGLTADVEVVAGRRGCQWAMLCPRWWPSKVLADGHASLQARLASNSNG
jgi:hypothetical protein